MLWESFHKDKDVFVQIDQEKEFARMEEIFKQSFLNGFYNQDITIRTVCVTLSVTLILAVYIFIVYRIIMRNAVYSSSFNVSLVGVALVTAAIIITIQMSVIVSLGMVGALSIVRFRTAIKEPMDLLFLYWSISTGIICGAGYGSYAGVLALFLTVAVIVLSNAPRFRKSMVLIVNAKEADNDDEILNAIKVNSSYTRLQSQGIVNGILEMTFEVKTKKNDSLVKEINNIETVTSVILLNKDE